MSRRVPKNPCPRVVDEYPRALVTLAHSSAEDILVCKVVLVVKTPLHSKMQIINKVNNVRQRNLGFWAERGKVRVIDIEMQSAGTKLCLRQRHHPS